MKHNSYEGFKKLAEFGIIAEGGTADVHLMPAKDMLEAMSALANIGRRTTLLCMGRPSPSPEDLGNVNVMVSPPEKGSFIMGVVVGVGSNVAANLITPHVETILKDVWSAAIGSLEAPVDEKVEPWFESITEQGEKLHSSFQQLSNPVDDSVEKITLFGGEKGKRKVLAVINAEAKRELAQEIPSADLECFEGRVRQLNDRTRKGIVHALSLENHQKEGPRGFRFWVAEGEPSANIVSALAGNLARNNSARERKKDFEIRLLGRRVNTIGGRTKRILIEKIVSG